MNNMRGLYTVTPLDRTTNVPIITDVRGGHHQRLPKDHQKRQRYRSRPYHQGLGATEEGLRWTTRRINL